MTTVQLTVITLLTQLLLIRVINASDELVTISRLRDDLLRKSGYDPNARPVKSHLTTIQLSAAIYLSNVIDYNVKTEILTTSAAIELLWTDEHLTWNPLDYEGLDSLIVNFDEIWTPDFYNWNELSGGSDNSGRSHFSLQVMSDGTVTWWPWLILKTPCYARLTNYPRDSSSCRLYFGLWANNGNEVNLTADPDHHSISGPVFESQEWAVTYRSLNMYSADIDGFDFPAISYSLVLSRTSNMYVYYVQLPSNLAIILVVASFILPLGSKVRLSFCGLALVIQIILIQLITNLIGWHSFRLPNVVKSLGLGVCMSGSVLIATQVNQLFIGGLSVPCPNYLRDLIQNVFVVRVFCLPVKPLARNEIGSSRLVEDANDQPITNLNDNLIDCWPLLALVINRIVLIVYLIVIAVYH